MNDKRGRRHSSVIIVAALPDATGAPTSGPSRADVRVDTFRATGPGGQHRNKTDSGVRLTHLPTGVVVTATEDRSQHANRKVAWDRLTAALDARASEAAGTALNEARSSVFGLPRAYTWTAWRDEVKTGGTKARMSACLSGELSALMQVRGCLPN